MFFVNIKILIYDFWLTITFDKIIFNYFFEDVCMQYNIEILMKNLQNISTPMHINIWLNSDFSLVLVHQTYCCSTCGRYYKAARSLTRHKKYECQKEPSFLCSVCPYRARYRNSLVRHALASHPDVYEKQISYEPQ